MWASAIGPSGRVHEIDSKIRKRRHKVRHEMSIQMHRNVQYATVLPGNGCAPRPRCMSVWGSYRKAKELFPAPELPSKATRRMTSCRCSGFVCVRVYILHYWPICMGQVHCILFVCLVCVCAGRWSARCWRQNRFGLIFFTVDSIESVPSNAVC